MAIDVWLAQVLCTPAASAGDSPASADAGQQAELAVLPVRDPAGRTEVAVAQRQLAFLAEASRELANTLDYEAIVQQVADLAVPLLADLCVVDLPQDDRHVRRLTTAHSDPAKLTLLRDLAERFPPDLEQENCFARVLRSGQPLLVPELSDEALRAFCQDEEQLALMHALGVDSAILAPLQARWHSLGVMTFVYAGSGRRYGPNDLTLAAEVAQRAALAIDNARLYRELQDAVRTRDAFLSSAAHDLTSPLTAIHGYAQLARQQITRASHLDREQVAGMLRRIETAVGEMSVQIDELRDLARLQAGRPLEMRQQAVDLVALVRQVATSVRDASKKHRIRVRAAVPTLMGAWDAMRLRRVFHNLLTNAVKYSPNGGDVDVELDRRRGPDGEVAVVVVRDQGIGIPAASLARVFEPFHRADNVGVIAGTGVGLASVRQIVEQHGGTVAVESVQGQGAVFRVTLPLTGAGRDISS